MCKTSTISKKGSLKTTSSPGSELHVIEGVQAFRRALPTCTNEALILSENGGDDEFTLDDYISDNSGERIMDSQLFQRSHVLQDTLNLRQFPKKSYMKASEDINAGSWNRYLLEEASRDQYHFRGW
ncbi:hypothetical protein HRG_013112 [Hirsutella rhossiliensis]